MRNITEKSFSLLTQIITNSQSQQLYFNLPSNNKIVGTLMSKNYAQALIFLLSKAEVITSTYNKRKDWSRVQTRTSILDELNKAHANPN